MPASIQNYYERLVMECIQDTLADTDSASDPEYVEDLACVALNQLPPRYVRYSIDLASHLGDEEHQAMRTEVAKAVGQAIETMARRQSSR